MSEAKRLSAELVQEIYVRIVERPYEQIVQWPEHRAAIEAEKQLILTAIGLAELRREAGLTQEQLAERLGVSQENVSRIERAEDTQLSTIRRYVEALGGSLELHAVFEDRDVPIAAA